MPCASRVTERLAVAAASVVAACGSAILSAPEETNVAVTMKMMSSTSVMSTIGVTLIPSTRSVSTSSARTAASLRLEVRQEHPGQRLAVRDHGAQPRAEIIVGDDRGDRHQRSEE